MSSNEGLWWTPTLHFKGWCVCAVAQWDATVSTKTNTMSLRNIIKIETLFGKHLMICCSDQWHNLIKKLTWLAVNWVFQGRVPVVLSRVSCILSRSTEQMRRSAATLLYVLFECKRVSCPQFWPLITDVEVTTWWAAACLHHLPPEFSNSQNL